MKDIDFDELDRAVGSVLGTEVASPITPAEPSAVVSSVPAPEPDASAVPRAPQPTVEPPAVSESTPPQATIKPSVSPARKRGQFLDMVHPSADMRRAPSAAPVVRRKIAPLTPALSVDDTTVAPTQTPETSAAAMDTTDDSTQDAWADLLGYIDDPETDDTASVATEQPQTPFMADANVGKRPLGAFAVQDEPDPVKPDSVDTPVPDSYMESPAPEFSPEVNSVEAVGSWSAEENQTAVADPVSPADTALPESHLPDSITREDMAEVELVPEHTVAQPLPAAEPAQPPASNAPAPYATAPIQSVSIPQQYRVAEPPKASEEHALFDTEEYHQPIAPEGKKSVKKVILIAILLIILLVVGGALGYVAYTVGI